MMSKETKFITHRNFSLTCLFSLFSFPISVIAPTLSKLLSVGCILSLQAPTSSKDKLAQNFPVLQWSIPIQSFQKTFSVLPRNNISEEIRPETCRRSRKLAPNMSPMLHSRTQKEEPARHKSHSSWKARASRDGRVRRGDYEVVELAGARSFGNA